MNDNDFLKKFGNRVNNFRNKTGLSQEKLATELGIDQSYLSEIETGKANPSLLYVKKLAEAFGVEPFELIVK